MQDNAKFKRITTLLYHLLGILFVLLPVATSLYWVFLNEIPEHMINVNLEAKPMVPGDLPMHYRLLCLAVSLLPLSVGLYGIYHLRRLFDLYRKGILFTKDHVVCLRRAAKALFTWVALSIVSESITGMIQTLPNPPGQRSISVGLGNGDLTSLVLATMVLVIAWVMEEAARIREEQELTV